MQVQVAGNVYSLTEGEPLPIQAGQTLRVLYAFSYKVVEQTAVPIKAALYTKLPSWTLPFKPRKDVEDAKTETTITLDASVEWRSYQGQIDIAVGSGVGAGVYGLAVESPGFEGAGDYIDDCIEVPGAGGIASWIGPIIMIAMMGMVMQMMSGMTKGEEIE